MRMRSYLRSAVHSTRLKIELILPHAAPLQSSFAHSPRRAPFDRGFTCPWVSFPLRDIPRAQLRLFADLPRSASFRAQAFAASPRFLPRSSLRACSIPLPRPGFLAVQGLLSQRSHPSSSEGAFLLAVAASPLVEPAPTFAGSCSRPRTMPLGFEASIHAGPRSSGSVIHLARGRSPLRIPSPPGTLSRRGAGSRRHLPLLLLASSVFVRSIALAGGRSFADLAAIVRARLLGSRALLATRCRALAFALRRPRLRASSSAPVVSTSRSSRSGSFVACTSRCSRKGVRRGSPPDAFASSEAIRATASCSSCDDHEVARLRVQLETLVAARRPRTLSCAWPRAPPRSTPRCPRLRRSSRVPCGIRVLRGGCALPLGLRSPPWRSRHLAMLAPALRAPVASDEHASRPRFDGAFRRHSRVRPRGHLVARTVHPRIRSPYGSRFRVLAVVTGGSGSPALAATLR